MTNERPVRAAIVDYGLGNLFSVRNACQAVGIEATITSERVQIRRAELVLLPGVGAFGDAMTSLRARGLVPVLREVAESGTCLAGVCLGLQLLFTESEEFGHHEGLNLIPGRVVKFRDPVGDRGRLKVPQVGWNQVYAARRDATPEGGCPPSWRGTPLETLPDGEYMYFVHSYCAVPESQDVLLSVSTYGNIEFCSSVSYRSTFACQFHPERSGRWGLEIYRRLARIARGRRKGTA